MSTITYKYKSRRVICKSSGGLWLFGQIVLSRPSLLCSTNIRTTNGRFWKIGVKTGKQPSDSSSLSLVHLCEDAFTSELHLFPPKKNISQKLESRNDIWQLKLIPAYLSGCAMASNGKKRPDVILSNIQGNAKLDLEYYNHRAKLLWGRKGFRLRATAHPRSFQLHSTTTLKRLHQLQTRFLFFFFFYIFFEPCFVLLDLDWHAWH